MGIAKRIFVLGLALVAPAAWPGVSAAEDSARPAVRVSPFAEDDRPAGQAKPAQPKPIETAPRKSNFQPRFKTPAIGQQEPVRQVQHTETVDEPASDESVGDEPANDGAEASEENGPKLSRLPPTPSKSSSGRALVDEAFGKSKTAKTERDYTDIIDLCRKGVEAGLARNFEDYAGRLMGWAYNRRGEMRAQAGKETEALVDFEAAVEKSDSSWRAIHNRAVSYAAAGRIKEAMADFDRTIELNKSYPNAFFNRGELRYAQNDLEGAIADYTTALRIGPPDSIILNSRGHTYYRLQKFGDALRDYGEAIKIDPANAAALIHRGDTYADLGKYAEAAQDYRAAVRVAPKLGRAYQSVAWLMATCPDEHYRNEKLAIDAATKAIELDGDKDFRYLETLAAAYANAGQFAEAKATQEKAIAKAPKESLVSCEKRMAQYQREGAFRERPRVAMAAQEAPQEHPVRQASGTSRDYPAARDNPQRTAPKRGNPPRNSQGNPARGARQPSLSGGLFPDWSR